MVVDMQKDFIDGSLGTKEAVGIVEHVANKIRNFEGRIFVTLDTHTQDYLTTAEGRKLPVPHCIKETEGWRLNDRVAAALAGKNVMLIEKETFASIRLAEEISRLAENGKIEIEIIGLCTDICVVSNALLLKANFPEAEISVDADGCAGVTPKLHDAALQVMSSCQIEVLRETEDEGKIDGGKSI